MKHYKPIISSIIGLFKCPWLLKNIQAKLLSCPVILHPEVWNMSIWICWKSTCCTPSLFLCIAFNISDLLSWYFLSMQWFNQLQVGRMLTVRDLLSWVEFINMTEGSLGPDYAFFHGLFLCLLDGLSLGNSFFMFKSIFMPIALS